MNNQEEMFIVDKGMATIKDQGMVMGEIIIDI